MFQQQLIAIVNDIEIAPDLTISHPDYQPSTLDPDLSTRYSQIPIELQTKFLTTRVRNYLHDLYFTGSLLPIEVLANPDRTPPPAKNNLVNGIDLDFFRQLDRHNTSRGYLDPGWQILAETAERETIVCKDGLHLHVDRQRYVPPEFHQSKIGELIPVFLPHNLVGVDTYIMVGNLGSPAPRLTDAKSSPLVRVYFNISPAGAIAIAPQLTAKLNQLGVPFQLSVLHNPVEFYRHDPTTLLLDRSSYLAIYADLFTLYRSHQADFAPTVPIFTKQLAPGLGIAEEPMTTDAFGIHRCELVAEGLVSAFDRGQSSTADRLDRIATVWERAQIDRDRPYLNPNATDDYDVYTGVAGLVYEA
jgi:HopA1 effector protein family